MGSGATAEVPDALEEVAVVTPVAAKMRCRRTRVPRSVDAASSPWPMPRPGPFLVIAEPEARLDLSAEAAHRRGCEDALGGAADAHDRVNAVPWTAVLIAADTSPSEISLIRAPVWRTSSISSAWRGRSRMITVMSWSPAERLAIEWTFSRRNPDVDLARCDRTDAELFEIGVRRVESPPAQTRRAP